MTANDLNYDQMRREECQKLIPRVFHIEMPVDEFLFDDIETGRDSYAVIFRSRGSVYALLIAENGAEQTLEDVRRIVKNMGLTAEKFLPPEADPQYFYRNGVELLKRVYPSLRRWNYDDVWMYSRKVPYSPALVKVASVDGEIRRFNQRGASWQKLLNYSFRKVQVRYE
ncbi:MAG: hypothetical protein ACFNMB_03055 [Candidatus Saccharimonas sp.]|jgi:hypothetical protein